MLRDRRDREEVGLPTAQEMLVTLGMIVMGAIFIGAIVGAFMAGWYVTLN